LQTLFFGRTRAGVVERCGLIAGIGDAAAGQARSGVVNHAIGADESIRPGLRGDESGVEKESDRLSDEVVEVLDRDLDGVFFAHFDSITRLRMKAKGRQPVAETTFGGKDPVLETETLGVGGEKRFSQVLEKLGATPAVDDPPTDQKEDGDRIKGHVPPGGGPAEALGQHVAQRAKVDQAEQEVKVGEVFPVCRVVEILPAAIDVVRAVGLLG
jgi:hypothetical protein